MRLFFYINQHHINGNSNQERCSEKFCENFKEFVIKMKVNNQQLGEMWMEMSNNFSDPEKKSKMLKSKPVY